MSWSARIATLGGQWTPRRLGASLLGWWDAERPDLITQSGGSVSSWLDVVGGYNAAQATGASKPIYSATSFNSRPGVSFDGVDDFLSLESAPLPTGSTASEVWVLLDQTALAADTSTRQAFAYGGVANASARSVRRAVSTGVNRGQVSAGDGTSSGFPTDATVDLSGRHVVRGSFVSGAVSVAIDGGAASTSTVALLSGTTRTRIGASTAATANNFYQGVIPLVVATSALNATDAAQLLAYLKARGGIS